VKVGQTLMAVEKSMGLKSGEKIVRLGLIKVVSVRSEPLNAITQEDVVREGFPNLSPREFIDFLVNHYGIKDESRLVNRIEYRYLDEEQTDLFGGDL